MHTVICFHIEKKKNMFLSRKLNKNWYQKPLNVFKTEQLSCLLALSTASTCKRKNNGQGIFIVSVGKSIKRQKQTNKSQGQLPAKGKK